jgi:hypothetical protein
MTKDTRNVLLIAGGVAVVGVIVYMVFAPAGTTSSLVYSSGTTKTNPTSTNQVTSAGISVGTSLIDKLFNINQPATPTT